MTAGSGRGVIFMRVGTIESAQHLLASARHNKRETAADHIDSARSYRNYALTPQRSALEVTRMARSMLRAAGLGNGPGLKPLRKNVIYAVEYLFSLPARFSGDSRAFFEDCLEWLTRHVCSRDNILSADVHLDEGAPHMQVLILPLINGRMKGSEVCGRKPVMRQRHASFFEEVGTRHGLKRRAPGSGKRRREANRLVLDHFRRNHPQLLGDPTWPMIREAIERDPDVFLCQLGLEHSSSPRPMRTMAEIFTSPGKGPRYERPQVGRGRPAPKSLCSVDFSAGIKPLAHNEQQAAAPIPAHSSEDGVAGETPEQVPASPAFHEPLETDDPVCGTEPMVPCQTPISAPIQEATGTTRRQVHRNQVQVQVGFARGNSGLSLHPSMTGGASARAPPALLGNQPDVGRRYCPRSWVEAACPGWVTHQEGRVRRTQECQLISRKNLEVNMGGSGSGRRPDSVRRKTSAAGMLDVRQLKRQGFFQPGQSMHWTACSGDGTLLSISVPAAQDKVLLAHRWQPEPGCWEAQSYEVELEWVPCHLGGQRPWFRCPIPACGRRVACLYLAPSGVYTCRHCQGLVYETQYERPTWRLMTKGDKIRSRLGWGPGILNLPGVKPKYMHWGTYERLRHREGRIVDALARLILPR